MRETAIQKGLVVPVRPASWVELAVAWFGGMLVGFVLASASTVFAGGPVALTWNQASDCSLVTGWELLVAPITTAQPDPPASSATLGVSFPNAGSPCGLNMARTVTTSSGVGQQRFWLRAFTPGGVKSAESNAVEASMPLGKPSGLTVVPQ